MHTPPYPHPACGAHADPRFALPPGAGRGFEPRRYTGDPGSPVPPALLGPCITLYKTRGKSLLAAQMHGGFWQFGVLVVATSHQPPPPAAVDFYPPHPALLEPNFLVLWLSGWLLAGWLPPCPSLSLSLMSVLSISMHPLLSRFSSRLLSLPLLRSRSLHRRAAVSSALVKIRPILARPTRAPRARTWPPSGYDRCSSARQRL